MNRKPPVVINARFLTQPITGVQRFAVELCLRLKELLPEVVFVAPRGVVHPEIGERLGVMELGKLAGHLWEQLELPLILRRMGSPLLVNLCNTAPILYSNKVVCIHDLAFLVNPSWFSKSFAGFYKMLIPRVAKSSRKILTVSEYSKGTIVEYLAVPANKIEVVYNAVSEATFSATGIAGNKYGNYVLVVGSLDPRKNLKTLVSAFNASGLQDTKLVIAGGSSSIFNDPEFKEQLMGNPSIVLTGYLSDEELRAAYRHAKLFVYPSLFEGFGLPPLEAMYCGCATMVSNTTSLPEVCADASYYVNPTQPAEIAHAIRLLLEDVPLRQSLVEKGFARSREFSWEKSAQRLKQILESLSRTPHNA
ncbi:glycosyltransferase family 4 protein [Pontibacter roseus]|uniref:glycosyltransferase family 4 protein n=1 Tax=Pontibacter roseus TaxID=336989 RepID=UPI00146138D6|nr:glycosyltransferase family 1 protein [Pontibacter roseus]